MLLSEGAQVGAYTITGSLGAGGMGEVYKARDTRLNRTVALKLLKEDLLGQPDHAERLEREARMIAGLSHPHICVLHDIGLHEGRRYLVMEFLEGETLADRLRRGPMPRPEALARAREVAAALSAAHAHGIVHRDLKPANVMLTRSGAKLLDFGLAKVPPEETNGASAEGATVSAPLTGQWEIVGTLRYMPPESLQGRSSDRRADIFAFGALFYEMLTGRPAFPGDTQAEIVASVLKSEPAHDDRIPGPLDRVVRRCLAKDPADRWQGMGDVAEALALAAETEPQPASRFEKPPRRGWMIGVGGALLTLVAGAYLGGVPGFVSNPRPVIVLMDSTVPERVYDPATRASGGTNSDDITDTLRDLPVELHKETTSALWHREDQVVQQHPAIVMMHLSSFAQASNDPAAPLQPQAHERTKAFLGFVGLASPSTKFVVYTRGFHTDEERAAWVDDVVQRFPSLRGRVHMLHIPGEEQATFRDQATRTLVRREVESLIGYSER